MRKKRIWYPGAMYHVMNRGVNHQNIFGDQADYEYFRVLLEYAKKDYLFVLHAYCFMTNHFHLLLETKEEAIWKIMKKIGESYAGYYNDKYERDGPLFRGRYRAVIVEDDTYFLQVSRYITLNPVQAGMVTAAEHYKWSSYQTFLGMADDRITDTEKTLAYFKHQSRLKYREFVEDKVSYIAYESQIQKEIKEDDLWLPW